MKKIFFACMLPLMGLMAACSDDEIEDISQLPENEVERPAFKVTTPSITGNTRAELGQDNQVLWSKDDYISIYNKSDRMDVYRLSEGAGTPNGTFVFDRNGATSQDPVKFRHTFALYPNRGHFIRYDMDDDPNSEDVYLDGVTVEKIQDFRGTFDLSAMPMVAMSSTNALAFKNLCGLIHLRLQGKGTVTSIKVSCPGKDLSGTFIYRFLTDNLENGSLTINKDYSNAADYVELNCKFNGEGVPLYENNPIRFYLVLPPVDFQGNLVVTVKGAEGQEQTFVSTSTKNVIRRNSILNMPPLDVDLTRKVQNDEIWVKMTPGTEPVVPAGFTIKTKDQSGYCVLQATQPITEVSAGMFKTAKELVEIKLPESVQTIGDNAFNNCSNLTSVHIPSAVTSIGKDAFSMCMALKDVTFAPNSKLETIDENAFTFCEALKKIELPASLKLIAPRAFEPTGLEELVLPENLESIGTRAFASNEALKRVVIPASLKSMGEFAFLYCKTLQNVTFAPNSQLKAIQTGTFVSCEQLGSINLPAGLKTIGERAFEKSGLTSITIPSSVDGLGIKVLSYCPSLASVTFESGSQLKNIPQEAFAYNPKLKTIKFAEGLESIGNVAFCEDVALESVAIPASVTTMDASSFSDCSKLHTVTFAEGSAIKVLSTGVFGACVSLQHIVLPETLEKIEGYAFYGCTALKQLRIPSKVTNIEMEAFSEAGLTSLTILAPYKEGIAMNEDTFLGMDYATCSLTMDKSWKAVAGTSPIFTLGWKEVVYK